MKIDGKIIGEGTPCFVIAEIGMNHDGDKEKAKKLILAAAEAGADAVKFQTFKAQDIVNPSLSANYDPEEPVPPQFTYFYQYIKQFELPYEWHDELIDFASEHQVIFLSTPCSIEALEFLSGRLPAFKIASMDLTNIPFLQEVGRKKKPVILSTGIGTLSEIEMAIQVLRRGGAEKIALMHCISNYPARPEELNLRNIPMLRETFNVPIGFSDHSLGIVSSIAAVALGASIIEKHITIDRKTSGPDHYFALEPHELKQLMAGIREVEKSLGSNSRIITEREELKRVTYRRSLVLNKNLPKGYKLRTEDISIIRPGSGIPPEDLYKVIGMILQKDLPAYTPLEWEHFKP